MYDEYIENINEDYIFTRENHYESLKERNYVSLSEARKRKLQLNWDENSAIGSYINLFLFFNIFEFLKILIQRKPGCGFFQCFHHY